MPKSGAYLAIQQLSVGQVTGRLLRFRKISTVCFQESSPHQAAHKNILGGGVTMQSTHSGTLGRLCSIVAVALTLAVSGNATARYGGGGGGGSTTPKNNFNIMMNYELGMHCTGFEFSYCCVLPPYNSILAQVVKTTRGGGDFPTLLEGDPNVGLDFLGRPTVLRDPELDSQGKFKKYVLRYWHDAQPRNDGRGAPQTSTLISQVEGNSMLLWNTQFDAAATDGGNKLNYGNYGSSIGAAAATNLCIAGDPSKIGTACSAHTDCETSPALKDGLCDLYGHQASSPKNHVMLGDGDFTDAEDNYANGWLNHFYIYADLEGSNPANTSAEKNKIRLGLPNTNASTVFSTVLPQNSGPAFHPLGPGATPGLNNVLTFSGDSGTVVFTQMKVLENLPVMLTSPRIWEALGLPLDPFEDTINFFGDPGAVSEETVRPYVQMKAALHKYDPSQPGGIGSPVLQNGHPVIGMGDAPIDIPNCERCHGLPGDVVSINNANNPDNFPSPTYPSTNGVAYRPFTAAKVQLELDYWNAYYGIDTAMGDSDWYSRLKAAAISILSIHDDEHRTDFTLNYPQTGGASPQLTRLGHESVVCQRCHADNVIAVVKSADTSRGLIPPLSEAIHDNHAETPFDDSKGRSGSCQGCHPAHRSDGDLSNYPITTTGLNFFATGDNRDAAGGCFVGRDVHSNPGKDADGAGTPEHLTAVGEWLKENVFDEPTTYLPEGGIWCTNCHSQLSQEIWRNENMVDLIHGVPGKQADGTTDAVNIRALPTLADIAAAVNAGAVGGQGLSDEDQAIAWLDPKFSSENTFAVWDGGAYTDANVATIEVNAGGSCNVAPYTTSSGGICVALDVDGDPSVRILNFCTTPDCVAAAQAVLDGEGNGSTATAVPFSAADDARDHWLAAGEPHCADCHQAPYTEQSGNISAYPPFNYPQKASLFRYTRGHRDITCQGCHESTHGLYPVTPDIDTTTYAQAASMNTDGSHGPLKCGACHDAKSNGVMSWASRLTYQNTKISQDFDKAVSWMHTATDEADPRADICTNCHEDQADEICEGGGGHDGHDGYYTTSWGGGGGGGSSCDWNDKWLEHTMKGRVSRNTMDKVEIAEVGNVAGDPAVEDPLRTVCRSCHDDESRHVSCSGRDSTEWKEHLVEGRVSQAVWEYVSTKKAGSTCGW